MSFVPEGRQSGTQSFFRRAGNYVLAGWHWITEEGRTLINVGLFFGLSAVLVLFLIFTIFRVQPRYTIHVTFAESGGVFTGQEVTYRGVTVGRVGEMKVVREGVRMQLIIEKKYNRIPQDGTKVRVMFKSAVGEQFVDLLPQKRTGPFLASGDEIPITATELPVQQEELLRLLDRVLAGVPPRSIGALNDALGQGLTGKGPDLREAFNVIDPLTAALANRADELNSLAIAGDKVGTAFDATAAQFEAGIKGLGPTASALGRGADGLGRLLEAGQEYVPDVRDLVDKRKAQIDHLLSALGKTTKLTADNIESVSDLLDWLPLLLDALVQSYDEDTNRFRFGLIAAEVRNPPCSYGTPRRVHTAYGDAPYHPILDFDC